MSFRDPAVVMAQVLSLCEKIETLRCIEGITAVEQDKQQGHEVCYSVVKNDISGRYLSPTRGLKRVDSNLQSEYSLIQSV